MRIGREETVGYGTRLGGSGGYVIYRLPDGSATREVICSIDADKPAYLHSFGLTEQYVVLTEPPLPP